MKERAEQLRELLAYHGHRYYVLDDPEIGFRRGAQHLRTLLSQIELNTPDQNAEASS